MTTVVLINPIGEAMFQGSMVAMVTPMHSDGEVDNDALQRLVAHHLQQETDAIIAVGTTGESATLSHDEHIALVGRVVEHVAGQVPVIAGTGANSTSEAISLTERAKVMGADACLLVTPYYNKPTQEGLYRHFKAVAEAVDIPQLLYNVPGRTACDLLPATVARLAAIPNIIGIKDATDMQRVEQLVAACEANFIILSGNDPIALDTILAGGRGVISVTANVAPQLMHQMCASALAGDADAARRMDSLLQPLHQALLAESNPIPTKWALHQLGLIGDGIRLPLTPLSEAYHDTVRAALRHANVI